MIKKLFARIKRAFDRFLEKREPKISERKIARRKKKYIRKLKNKDFSILCSNCIGGEIYNRLGMKFLSHTINMWQSQSDFIKFALNTEYYINQPLCFIETDEATPVAKCGDLTLHFNHSKNAAYAENDWNRRKSRINFDNVYIIFYADKLSLDEIRKIEQAKCKNIAVITDKPLPLRYAVPIKPNAEQHPDVNYAERIRCIDKDRYNLYTFEKQWDFVKWLNSELEL